MYIYKIEFFKIFIDLLLLLLEILDKNDLNTWISLFNDNINAEK